MIMMMTAKRARALSHKSRYREYRRVKAKVLCLMKIEIEYYGNTDVLVVFSDTSIGSRKEKFYYWLVGKKLERKGFKVEFNRQGVMRIYW